MQIGFPTLVIRTEKFQNTSSLEIKNETGTVLAKFDNVGNLTLGSLTGADNDYLCITSAGVVYRSDTACA
jgi:hypothetical protein